MRASRLAILAGVLALGACGPTTAPPPAAGAGDPEAGAVLLVREACGACHRIPGIQDAYGEVGPPLAGIGRRTIIAGVLPNTADNMARWIRQPQAIVPGNAMPDIAITDQQAHDMAAYLETLR